MSNDDAPLFPLTAIATKRCQLRVSWMDRLFDRSTLHTLGFRTASDQRDLLDPSCFASRFCDRVDQSMPRSMLQLPRGNETAVLASSESVIDYRSQRTRLWGSSLVTTLFFTRLALGSACCIQADLKTMKFAVSDAGLVPKLQDILADLPSVLAALDVLFLYALGKQWISGAAHEQTRIDLPGAPDLPHMRVELGFDVDRQYWVRGQHAGT